MKTVLLSALILISACDEWKATPAAGTRRMAEARLANCRKGLISGIDAKPCYAQVQAFCLDAGIERTCGESGFQ